MYKAPPGTIREEFESLPEGTWCQVVNKRLIMSPSTTVQHQRVLGDIVGPLHDFVEEHKLGEVVLGPIDTYLDAENFFQPDLLYIINDRLHIIDDYIRAAPDLIVEALLPASARLDKEEKKEVYESCGVMEYWIVDPETKKCWVMN